VIVALYPPVRLPPSWNLREAGGLRVFTTSDIEAAQIVVWPVLGHTTGPEAWLEATLAAEEAQGFLVTARDPVVPIVRGGVNGVSASLTGGYARPDALVERRTYVVLSDGELQVALSLQASVATYAAAEPAFAELCRSLQ
jgi:hypothetical protein